MVENLSRGGFPDLAGRLEEGEGPQNVGPDELFGAPNGAVHMALGGEVDDGVHLFLPEDLLHQGGVSDVPPKEPVPSGPVPFGQPLQVLGVPRVGQLVQVDDLA